MEDTFAAIDSATIIKLKGGITVFQDGTHLKHGSKMRGVAYFQKIKDEGYTEVAVAASCHGYTQESIAAMCKHVGLKLTIFVNSDRGVFRGSSLECTTLGATVIDPVTNGYTRLRLLDDAAKKYATTHRCKYISIGINEEEFYQAMIDNITKMKMKYNLNPFEVWVASSTGCMAKVLGIVFPLATIHIVEVGMAAWPDVIKDINCVIHRHSSNLDSGCSIRPPYKSYDQLDAKLWTFARRRTDKGALIFNLK